MIRLLKGFILLTALICLLISQGCEAKGHRILRQYDARIMDRPDDVAGVKCGEDIKLTCVAEGSPSPEIQWRYYNQETNVDEEASRVVVRHSGRDGRIKIKTEELYVVRSTLIIRNADSGDEGMYQCRASNYVNRNNHGINVNQHWRIEEVPVGKVMCKGKTETVITHTEVYPASTYNRSVFDKAVERVVTSTSSTSSTTDLKKLTSLMTSSSTGKPPSSHKPKKNHHKMKSENSKKSIRNMVEKGTQKTVTAILIGKDKSFNERIESPIQGSALDQNDGDGNSGLGIYKRPWILAILHFPISICLFMLSSW
uniref:uncharacterized protein LOC120334892 n=1 Tax=Styela clava TaxID=7725 RepID=UPI00193A8B09|nr:uncharacterized protein LOC120334892 [Styela clava]